MWKRGACANVSGGWNLRVWSFESHNQLTRDPVSGLFSCIRREIIRNLLFSKGKEPEERLLQPKLPLPPKRMEEN